MLIDIVILPPPKLARALGTLGSSLSKNYSLLYAVDNKKLLSHLSLYHLVIKPLELDPLLRDLKVLSQKQKAIPLTITGVIKGEFHFAFSLNNPKSLQSLHHKVLAAAKDFHSGKTPWLFPLRTKRLRYLFESYGVPNVLENFDPHFTIGWARKSADAAVICELLKQNTKRPKKFLAKRLAVVEVDKYFQATKILKEFSLKTN